MVVGASVVAAERTGALEEEHRVVGETRVDAFPVVEFQAGDHLLAACSAANLPFEAAYLKIDKNAILKHLTKR